MKIVKKFYLILLAVLFVTANSVPAFAFIEGLQKDDGGYYFEKSDGERARNEWVHVQYEDNWYWYYMNENTYPLRSAITPDGYKVNARYHWIDEANLSRDPYEYNLDYMHLISNWVFNDFYEKNPTNLSFNKKRENFTSADKAFITYAYIYNCRDSRINKRKAGYYTYNVVSRSDVMSIMKDLTGSSNESDMDEFAKYGTPDRDNYWIEEGGDFGDVGLSYLSSKNIELSIEGNRVKITGDVMHYKANSGHVPIKKYSAYFTISDAPQMDFLRFDELNIQ